MLSLLPIYFILFDDTNGSIFADMLSSFLCVELSSCSGVAGCNSTHRSLLMVMFTSTQIRCYCSIYVEMIRRSRSSDYEVQAQKVSRVTP